MQCEQCHHRKATIALTVVVEDERVALHLCRACAAERGLGAELASDEEGNAMAQRSAGSGQSREREGDRDRCPSCGLTYAQFKERYRLGCTDCYTAFRERLKPLLRKVHGADVHSGKRPAIVMDGAPVEGVTWTLEVLKRRLQAAIEREEFEVAARIRDQIETLKRPQSGDSDE